MSRNFVFASAEGEWCENLKAERDVVAHYTIFETHWSTSVQLCTPLRREKQT
jgi:hypothetical protein